MIGVFFILSVLSNIKFERISKGTMLKSHRYVGRISAILILIIAYLCIFEATEIASIGFRVSLHKLLGTLTLTVLVIKLSIVKGLIKKRESLPITGKFLFMAIFLTWTTSALWYFIWD